MKYTHCNFNLHLIICKLKCVRYISTFTNNEMRKYFILNEIQIKQITLKFANIISKINEFVVDCDYTRGGDGIAG